MGLDTSHGCWHGAYSAFMRWRTEIAKAAGIPLMFMDGFHRCPPDHHPLVIAGREQRAERDRGGPVLGPKWDALADWALDHDDLLPLSWSLFKGHPLVPLLNHSDCEGSIASADCGPLADALESLLPKLPQGSGGGHIGDWREKTQTFIDGLRRAATAGEDVGFH